MKKIALITLVIALFSSCASQKEVAALQRDLIDTQKKLEKTTEERDALNEKMLHIQQRISAYYGKLNKLKSAVNEGTNGDHSSSSSTDNQLAQQLLESLGSKVKDNENVNIYVDQSVVSISISNKLLFNSGGYKVKRSADEILKKIAEVVNSDESVSVMVEGHTDNVPIKTVGILDNWDLSVKRATSVVRKLQRDHKVAPEKLMASGRGSYIPMAPNDTSKNRAKNRRIRILILPNIYKHLSFAEEQ